MSEQTLAPYQDAENLPAIGTDLSQAIVFDESVFNRVEKVAQVMASGRSTVPDHLKNSEGDCMAVVMQSMTWGMNPWSVAQKTHLVKGTLGYEAQLVNAVINAMAPTKDRIHYEWFGDWDRILGKFIEKNGQNGKYTTPGWDSKDEEGLGVRVWATLKGEDEPRELRLLLRQAVVRNSTLWSQDPRQQLAYLAVKRWSRLYCPDVILGVYTPDELDTGDMRDVTPQKPTDNTKGVSKLKAMARGEKIADKDQAVDVPTKEDFIERLLAAESETDMIEATKQVTQLGAQDQDAIRKAYANRLKEIRGEDANKVVELINQATGLEDIAFAGDKINLLHKDLRADVLSLLQQKQQQIVESFSINKEES